MPREQKIKRGQNKSIVIPILNWEYKAIVCWGSDKFVKRVIESWGHEYNESLVKRGRGATVSTEKCNPVIVLHRFPKLPEEIGTLAHEATHAIDDIFHFIEEGKSREVYAHCVAAIVRETLKSAK